MILIDKIKLETFGNRRLKYYSELGYDISGEYIEVRVDHINRGSRTIIKVECDFCKKIAETKYKEYLRNISIGGKYACCKICGSEKAKVTNLKNIGVSHPMKLVEIQDKTKKTNLERYGVEFLQQSPEIREKSKKSIIENWSVDHISKTEYYKDKIKETNLERYGVEYAIQSEDIRLKLKQTLLENYGVDNPSKSSIILEKVKETNFKKYGNKVYLKTDDFKIKNSDTLNHKWLSDNIMKSDLFRYDRFSISKDVNYLHYLENSISVLECESGHEFNIHIDNYLKRSLSNLPLCTICNPIGDSKSIKEKELFKYIKSIYQGQVIQSYRDGLEIDIYLPQLKLGFEFNGLYWHSEEFKDKNYHLSKTNYFEKCEINIIHIWEDDWIFKNKIIKSQIKNWIGLSDKIWARKCYVKEVKDAKITSNFLQENHIQGSTGSNLKLGLYYDDELISLMIFDHFEGRKKMEDGGWNLSRFCNKLNTTVVGGSSKLLKYFINNYDVSRIVSYADRDWSRGSLYENLGFSKVSKSNTDYKYVIDNKRVNKSKFRKSNLNTQLTESQYMKKNKIQRIWDCGKIKFELKLLSN